MLTEGNRASSPKKPPGPVSRHSRCCWSSSSSSSPTSPNKRSQSTWTRDRLAHPLRKTEGEGGDLRRLCRLAENAVRLSQRSLPLPICRLKYHSARTASVYAYGNESVDTRLMIQCSGGAMTHIWTSRSRSKSRQELFNGQIEVRNRKEESNHRNWTRDWRDRETGGGRGGGREGGRVPKRERERQRDRDRDRETERRGCDRDRRPISHDKGRLERERDRGGGRRKYIQI